MKKYNKYRIVYQFKNYAKVRLGHWQWGSAEKFLKRVGFEFDDKTLKWKKGEHMTANIIHVNGLEF